MGAAVTEALSTKGSAGVELLTKCMNRYFSQVGSAPLQPACLNPPHLRLSLPSSSSLYPMTRLEILMLHGACR